MIKSNTQVEEESMQEEEEEIIDDKNVINSESDNHNYFNTLTRPQGNIDNYISMGIQLLEHESSLNALKKHTDTLDNILGISPSFDTKAIIPHISTNKNIPILFLGGYAHYLVAKELYDKGASKKEINFENEKAILLLSATSLQGHSKYLDKAASLKRKVNWKKYCMLCFDVLLIFCLVTLALYLYRYLQESNISFF